MNVLDLFTGVGGGILGGLLCGHRIVCAVELDPFCRSVLTQRQNDGHLPPFPIWDDVRTFDGRRWRGIVDVVSGGFPCQNISPAGDRTGIKGEKSSLWLQMLRIIREVRPRYVFVENSAELIRNGLDVVLGGLVKSGYDAEWCVLGASDVGAPHIRKRCWILGRHTNYKRTPPIGKIQTKDTDSRRVGKNSYADGQRQPQSKRLVQEQRRRTGNVCEETDVENTDCQPGQAGWAVEKICLKTFIEDGQKRQTDQTFRPGWWEVEPGFCRVVNDVPHRLHRLKGLGNAQVPLCAAVAWKVLFERIHEQ